jgi:hypothetical protein
MAPFRATALACIIAALALVGLVAAVNARTVTFDRGGICDQ